MTFSFKKALAVLTALSFLSAVAWGFSADRHYQDFLAALGGSGSEVPGRLKVAYKKISSDIIDNAEIRRAFGTWEHRNVWGHSLGWLEGTDEARRMAWQRLREKGWAPERIAGFFDKQWPPRGAMRRVFQEHLPELTDGQIDELINLTASHPLGDANTAAGIPGSPGKWKEVLQRVPDAQRVDIRNKLSIARIIEEKGCTVDEAVELFWRQGGANQTVLSRLMRGLDGTLTEGPQKTLIMQLDNGTRYIPALTSEREAKRVIKLADKRGLRGKIVVDEDVYEALRRSGDDTVQSALRGNKVVAYSDEFADTIKTAKAAEQAQQAKAASKAVTKVTGRLPDDLVRLWEQAAPWVDWGGVVVDVAFLAYYSHAFYGSLNDPYANQLTQVRYGTQTTISAVALGSGVVLLWTGPPGWAGLAIVGALTAGEIGADYVFAELEDAQADRFRQMRRKRVRESLSITLERNRNAVEHFNPTFP